MTYNTTSSKVYALVDCDSFYCSVEGNSLFRPDLVASNAAIIVASNNDGCCVARNRRAKELGIKMGDPLFKIQDLIRKNNVAVFSSNYANYANMSARVMKILSSFTPEMEVYSIDEAFLDLSGHRCDLEELGRTIKSTVRAHTGLSVGVGISTNLTLSKLASYAGKTYRATGGVVDLTCKTRQERLLEITPVGEVWGVGRRITRRLNEMGIETAAQLARTELQLIRDQFSVVLERTVRELRGEPVLSLELVKPTQKQIVHSRAFGQPVSSLDELREPVHSYAVKAMEKARKQGLTVKTLSVFIQTNPFHESSDYLSAAIQFPMATSNTFDILRASSEILRAIWKPNKKYVRAGVMLVELLPEGNEQLSLIDARNEKAEHLMRVIDGINSNGKAKVFFASQGVGERNWHMKRQFLSPHYLTRWSDIPVVS